MLEGVPLLLEGRLREDEALAVRGSALACHAAE